MIARSFKSVVWVAAIAVAALVCYMFSMRVAEERAGLAELEAQISRTQQSIQTLKTELGTRGRVHQLQHWAATDFGFTSPKAGQFLDGEVTLARLDMQAQMPAQIQPEAPVQMAQAQPAAPQLPKPVEAASPVSAPARPAIRQASASPERERPLLRQAAMVRTQVPAAAARPAATPARPARAAAAPPPRPATRPAAKPAARATALLNTRTLNELNARSADERADRRAN